MNNALNFVAGAMALVVLAILFACMLLVIWYAFEKATFEHNLHEMKRDAAKIAQEGDK
jgi:hypothetical protein